MNGFEALASSTIEIVAEVYGLLRTPGTYLVHILVMCILRAQLLRKPLTVILLAHICIPTYEFQL